MSTEEEEEEQIEELKPLEVKVIADPVEEKNPTSEDTKDYYQYTPTEEEIKEMTDAQ